MKIYLNFLELEKITEQMQPLIQGLTADRIIIPHRPYLKKGYGLHEWVLRLKSKNQKKNEKALLFSTQNAQPYQSLYLNKGPQAFEKAATSVFLQNLNKNIKNLTITHFTSIPNERITFLEFTNQKRNQVFILAMELIPARPNLYWIEKKGTQLHILLQERGTPHTFYSPPVKKQDSLLYQNKKQEFRQAWIQNPEEYTKSIEKFLETIEKKRRFVTIDKMYQKKMTTLQKIVNKNENTLHHIQKDPPWGYYGHLIKSNLGVLNKKHTFKKILMDYEKNEEVEIPLLPDKSPIEVMELYFQKEKRNKRKQIETEQQILNVKEKLEALSSFSPPPFSEDLSWKTIEDLEIKLEINPLKKSYTSINKNEPFMGKIFYSQEGHRILVGRSKEENHALTFKVASGNDLWLHLRGRPSAHVIIQLLSGAQRDKKIKKTASLETLMDAATVLIYYSKAQHFGKCDVDYTYKKFVKRIKNSEQVSYSQNKTLFLEFDAKRFDMIQKRTPTTI